MSRRNEHRNRDHRSSFFEPLEDRRLLSAGTLDTSFSLDGKATPFFGTGLTVRAKDVAVQADGKTVVAGHAHAGSGSSYRSYFAVTRFNADGTPDRSFGSQRGHLAGTVLTPVASREHTYANAVAIQPDGKIILAGAAKAGDDNVFAVVRYNPDGSLDTTFDGDGKVTVKFHDVASVLGIALQKDGKIVLAGHDFDNGLFSADSDFAVARLNPNGSLDRTFDGDGKVTIGFGGDEYATGVAIDYTGSIATNPNWGKIVLAGDHRNGDYSGYGVTRLNANGSVDRTFNQANAFNRDGKLIATFDPASYTYMGKLTLQRDGKIVLAGTVGNGNVYGQQQFVLVRLNSDGWFDRSFGDRGKVVTGFGGNDRALDVVQSSDGGLIAAGTVNGRLALAAYTSDGRLNARFGQGGRVKLDHGNVGWWDTVGIATAPGRKLVIAGGNGFATARLFDNGGSVIRDPNLIGKPLTTRRALSVTPVRAQQSNTAQPTTPVRDLFSSERIDPLRTL